MMDRIRNERTGREGLTSHPDPSVAGRKDRPRFRGKKRKPNDLLEAYTGIVVGRERESHPA